MDGSQVLGVGLAALAQALKSRRLVLMDELRQVERDLETIDHTRAAARRCGFGADDPVPSASPAASASPAPSAASSPRRATGRKPAKARRHDAVPNGGSGVDGSDRDFRLREAALASFGRLRDDAAIPSKLDEQGRPIEAASMPTGVMERRAMAESVHGIAAKAAAMAPGPGGRRNLSTKGLVSGEPIASTLRRVLEASDRPLSTAEVTAAFTTVRGMSFEGRDLVAINNRISSILSSYAPNGWVVRLHREGSRTVLWRRGPQSTASSQPSGSTG